MSNPAPSSRSYITTLDGLRAVAVVAVLVYHGAKTRLAGGFLGVDLFFVLSGFLITRLLIVEWGATGGVNLGMFIYRRVLRLLPALIAAVLFAGLLWPLVIDGSSNIHWHWAAFAALFFHANLVHPERLGLLVHTWSLSIEWQFYALWPLLLRYLVLARHSLFQVASIVPLLISILAVRTVAPLELLESLNSALRIDGLLIGALIAMLIQYNLVSAGARRLFASPLVAGLLLALLMACFVVVRAEYDWFKSFGYPLFGLLSGLTLLALIYNPPASPLARLISLPPLLWLGSRSYGLYLYHLPIFLASESLRNEGDVLNFVLVAALRAGATCVVAELSYRFVESPWLARKRAIGQREPSPAVALGK